MHQFLLYGSISQARHEQVLNILAGVCAVQPTAFADEHVFYAPAKSVANGDFVNPKKKPVGTQQRYYHELVRQLDVANYAAKSAWRLVIKEEPEAGSPNQISQPYTETENVDWTIYDMSKEFTYSGRQVKAGHFFVHGNVVLKVFRVWRTKDDELLTVIALPLSKDNLLLLDASGTFVVEACVRLEDRKNSRLSDEATKELLDMKRTLQGAVSLFAPDRLALDTRVRDG